MAKTLTLVFGAIFTLVGLLGFAASFTTSVPFIGDPAFSLDSLTKTLVVDKLHSAIHLLTGLIALSIGFFAPGASAAYLKIGGVVYALVAILGFAAVANGPLPGFGVWGVPPLEKGFMLMNTADNILHVVLAVGLLGAGFLFGKKQDVVA